MIAFANSTTALDSPSLIGMLMQAQTTDLAIWFSQHGCETIVQ